MLFQHRDRQPKIADSAYIAPNAVVSGDVTIGAHSRVLFGSVLTAEGGPMVIGSNSIIMENTVLRSARRHPMIIGNHVLVGPRAYLSGCSVEDNAFLATGSTVFNGAHIGLGAELRINAVVHVRSRIRDGAVVPIGWVAVGDPAQLFPPDQHDRIWAIQKTLDFPGEVFGLARADLDVLMPELTIRYARALAQHREDRRLDH